MRLSNAATLGERETVEGLEDGVDVIGHDGDALQPANALVLEDARVECRRARNRRNRLSIATSERDEAGFAFSYEMREVTAVRERVVSNRHPGIIPRSNVSRTFCYIR